MSFGHLVKRIRESQALDAGYDEVQARIDAGQRGVAGDTFDLFLRRQRYRITKQLDRAVERVKQATDDTEVFESRK
jgi:uncharacterized alpha-E superfamily protein